MKTTKIEALTFLRFIAAFFVVMFHVGRHTNLAAIAPSLTISGPAMVTFFFVLSGFVLTVAYYGKENSSLKSFYLARVARIVPIYLIALGLVYSFDYGQRNNGYRALLLNIAFIQSWFPPYPLSFNFPAWSLSVEAFFYLTFPFILFAIKNIRLTPKKTLLASLLIWLFTQAILLNLLNSRFYTGNPSPSYDLIYFFPLSHFCSFLLGIAGGHLFLQTPNPHENNGKLSFLLFAIIINYLIFQYSNIYEQWLGLHLPTSAYAPSYLFLILCLSYSKNAITDLLSLRVFTLLGEASYSLYILQYPIYTFYMKYLSAHLDLNQNDDFLCFLVILISISILSLYTIEKTGRNLIYKSVPLLENVIFKYKLLQQKL